MPLSLLANVVSFNTPSNISFDLKLVKSLYDEGDFLSLDFQQPFPMEFHCPISFSQIFVSYIDHNIDISCY